MIKNMTRYGIPYLFCIILLAAGGLPLACGGSGSSEADDEGIGAECTTAADCEDPQVCLSLKGGYCTLICIDDDDCPDGSLCGSLSGGIDHCFLTCTDKSECNNNRGADDESNCSSDVDFVESHPTTKACVPPSS